jgi:hypothetical protein
MADRHVLPFVAERPSRRTGFGRTFWAPPCEGLGYFEACELGEELALEAIRYMRATELRALLGWAAMDMPRRLNEAQKGTMVGFFAVFAELALRAASPRGLAAYELDLARQRERLSQLMAEAEEEEDDEPAG